MIKINNGIEKLIGIEKLMVIIIRARPKAI